jgi:hypothetical protein
VFQVLVTPLQHASTPSAQHQETDLSFLRQLRRHQKALEKKDAEILDLRFATVITKINATAEALNTKIDTIAEALKKD